MAVTQYIGSRYVPLFADPVEWTNTRTYEPLTVVLYQGNSFTSRQFVPKDIDITNEDFWVETGNYNAQVEQYRQDVARWGNRIGVLEGDLPIGFFSEDATVQSYIEGLQDSVNGLSAIIPANEFSSVDTVKAYIDATNALIPSSAFTSESTVKDYIDVHLSETFIRPESFGAVGDGTTDDSAAFTAMFNAVSSNDGTTIIMLKPATTYAIHGVWVNASNVVIIGNGATLKSDTTSCLLIPKTAHDIKIDNVTFDEYFTKGDTTTPSNSCIGIAADSATEEYQAYNIEIGNCVFNCGVFGIAGTSVMNLHIHDCAFYGGTFKPEDAAGGYGILTQSCVNVVIENCYFKMGAYARHDIYVSVSQPKTAFKSSRNYKILNCYSDKSLQVNDPDLGYPYGGTILSIAVRSVYNLTVENVRVYDGTGVIALNDADGAVINASVINCVNDHPRFISGSVNPNEVRNSYTVFFNDHAESCAVFDSCQTIDPPSGFLNYSLTGTATTGSIELKNCEVTSVCDIGLMKYMHIHDVTVYGAYFRYVGLGVAYYNIHDINGSNSNVFASTHIAEGYYIDISSFDKKMLGPYTLSGTNGNVAFNASRPHVPVTFTPSDDGYTVIAAFPYCNRPLVLSDFQTLTDGSIIEINNTAGGLATNEVRIRKRDLTTGNYITTAYPACRFYL